MLQATQQWNPHFCLNSKLFNVNQVLMAEPQAKDLLQQGSVEAVIQGEPPPETSGKASFFPSPTVQAPIAVTGFAISYVIDNADGTSYTDLKLDPRLLAKLLTESYYATNNMQSNWRQTGLPPAAVLSISGGTPTSGSFVLSSTGSAARVPVAYDESDTDLQSAMQALWGGTYKVTGGPLSQAPVTIVGIEASQLSIYSSTLNNSAAPSVIVTEDPDYCPVNCDAAYAALANNPQSIFDDPEFIALNPTFTLPAGVQPAPAATLFSILAQSDVIWALTSYINSDPEARAWLNGAPDPWGMVVNPAYKGIQLPVESWPLLDSTASGPDYTETGNPFCYTALGTGTSREPDRPLVDNPQATLANVAYNLQYSIAASLITCNNNPLTPTYEQLGPEQIGSRFLMGVVSLPAAEEYGLDTASLQTYASSEPETTDQSAFAAPRAFVSPTPGSLDTAARLMKPNAAVGSWEMPYSDFPSDLSVKGAYPGTLLMSADVPTTGLPQPDATEYGQYLSFAATAGQIQGAGVGQLPPGYVPLTAADGLGAQVAYTQAAVADIAAQNGKVPPLIPGSATIPPSQQTAPHKTASHQTTPTTVSSTDTAAGSSSGSSNANGSTSSRGSSETSSAGGSARARARPSPRRRCTSNRRLPSGRPSGSTLDSVDWLSRWRC